MSCKKDGHLFVLEYVLLIARALVWNERKSKIENSSELQNVSDFLKLGVRGDEFEEERLERNAFIPFEQKKVKV